MSANNFAGKPGSAYRKLNFQGGIPILARDNDHQGRENPDLVQTGGTVNLRYDKLLNTKSCQPHFWKQHVWQSEWTKWWQTPVLNHRFEWTPVAWHFCLTEHGLRHTRCCHLPTGKSGQTKTKKSKKKILYYSNTVCGQCKRMVETTRSLHIF